MKDVCKDVWLSANRLLAKFMVLTPQSNMAIYLLFFCRCIPLVAGAVVFTLTRPYHGPMYRILGIGRRQFGFVEVWQNFLCLIF